VVEEEALRLGLGRHLHVAPHVQFDAVEQLVALPATSRWSGGLDVVITVSAGEQHSRPGGRLALRRARYQDTSRNRPGEMVLDCRRLDESNLRENEFVLGPRDDSSQRRPYGLKFPPPPPPGVVTGLRRNIHSSCISSRNQVKSGCRGLGT
jgi:hypothetical protein